VIEYYYRLRTGGEGLCNRLMPTTLDELNYQEYYNFNAAVLGHMEWNTHPALSVIADEFPIAQAGILRMEPNTGYDWHTDTDRQLAINMLVPTGPGRTRSETLFSPDHGEGVNYNLHRLNYQPYSLYVFNTQVKHTVLNFGQPRYLFSVEFERLPGTTYKNVRDFCISQGL